ncbi:MAG: (d)CMP kinase, partial [Oscillospiraceae bacterium]|nr:(d)CMP kinase [Oscillospiraceae bacterium]
PNAEVKIFLTATPEARAQRRYKELIAKGVKDSFEDVLKDIQYRDAQDSSRAAAPLKAADDAVILDNTELSFEESVEAACAIIEEKAGI